MKSDAYWSERLEALNESQLQKGEKYIRTMQREYDKAMASIQRDIDVFYQRFAENNRIDLATARQVLTAGQLKEFHWTVEEYIQRGRENAVDQRWMRQLENASIKVRVSRLEALQTQMRQHVEVLSAKQQAGAQRLLGGIYADNYHRSLFEVQRGTGVGSSFAKLDTAQLEKILSKPWAPDGSNFSSRIWKDKEKLVAELQTALTQSLVRGDPSDRVIREFAKRMDVSQSVARRLILTESAYFAGQSRLDAYGEMNVEQYKYTATLDGRTSQTCRHMDGEIFPVSEAQAGVNYPPLHAHCRSTTIPHFHDNVKERAARNANGETYDVPGDMTYEEWRKERVEKAAKVPGTSPDPLPSAQQEPIKVVETLPPTSSREKTLNQIKRYEDSIRSETTRHVYIATAKGEVMHTSNASGGLSIAEFGERLKDSILTHNHPPVGGLHGGSFSRSDVVAFVGYGMREMRAVDAEHTYSLRRSAALDIKLDELDRMMQIAEMAYKAKLTTKSALAGFDAAHLFMLALTALVAGLSYEREEVNDEQRGAL
ncbi:hypothetical protein CIG75_19030 [Tumebacillus algifaecis]|uniref:Phage head morphogenesis domain-containing protein n=1 Tax=Tumebacillus algifaecis TaxID=1214604 RepID=A0A223D5F8_9BACL|nr:minor capsid protein [Tumebacillus algifaecis]ASS76828.1 hypothetical protein CIG75_19030 [Tumebacillus algifaecis]